MLNLLQQMLCFHSSNVAESVKILADFVDLKIITRLMTRKLSPSILYVMILSFCPFDDQHISN
jgi:hypothetical protein